MAVKQTVGLGVGNYQPRPGATQDGGLRQGRENLQTETGSLHGREEEELRAAMAHGVSGRRAYRVKWTCSDSTADFPLFSTPS